MPPPEPEIKPGDHMVLFACLAALLIIASLYAAYLITHP